VQLHYLVKNYCRFVATMLRNDANEVWWDIQWSVYCNGAAACSSERLENRSKLCSRFETVPSVTDGQTDRQTDRIATR